MQPKAVVVNCHSSKCFEYYPTRGPSIGPLLARFQQVNLLCIAYLVDMYKAATTGNLLISLRMVILDL